MKRFVSCVPFALHGISAAAGVRQADTPTTPAAARDAPGLAGAEHPGLFTHRRQDGLPQKQKRHDQKITPAQLAELLDQLQVVYGYLAAYEEKTSSGLLNNLLRGLSDALPPLAGVLESVRGLLVGDSLTFLERLAVAQALGVHVFTTTTIVTVHRSAAAAVTETITTTQAGEPASLTPSASPSTAGLSSSAASAQPTATTAPSRALSDQESIVTPSPSAVSTRAGPSLLRPSPSTSLSGFSTGASLSLSQPSVSSSSPFTPPETGPVVSSSTPGFTPGVSASPVLPSSFSPSASLTLAQPTSSSASPPTPPEAGLLVSSYFGQPDSEGAASLLQMCADPNVDIVILGYVADAKYHGTQYPLLQLSASLPNTPTTQMRLAAPGLSFYAGLEAEIERCQSKHGKKIFLSIGGPGNALSLASDQEAIAFADCLWKMFGPAAKIDPGLRPFGSAVLDGFDLSKQDERAAHFDTFAATLRAHFATDTATKDYFLSAAPGCSFPDVSIHPGYLAQSNFVWPRFYNDSKCGIHAAGFLDAFKEWSHAISDSVVPMRDSSAFRTRLFVSLPADAPASAFLGGGLAALVVQRRAALLPETFGGFALSDITCATRNMLDGVSLLSWAGRALGRVVS